MLIEYYLKSKLFIIIAIALNISALFFIQKYLKRINYIKSEPLLPITKINLGSLIIIFVVSSFAFIWKMQQIHIDSLDTMEGVNINVGDNIPEALAFLISFAHQPLYPLIIKLIGPWSHFGESILLARLFSLFFGISTAWVIYIFSFKIFKTKPASYAAFGMALSHALLSFYSRRIEVYSVFCFLSLLSCYYFWVTFIYPENKSSWKYLTATIICFLTHYLTLVIIFAQLLTILLLRFSNRDSFSLRKPIHAIKALIVFNFVIIIYLPIIINTGVINIKNLFSDLYQISFYLNPKYIGLIIDGIIKLIFGLPWFGVFGYIFFLPFLFIFTKLYRKSYPLFVLISLLIVASIMYEALFTIYLLNMTGKLYFNVRHLIFLIPFVAILFGYGVSLVAAERNFVKRIAIGISLLIIICWNAIISNKIVFTRINPAYKKALTYIRNRLEPEDVVTWPVIWMDDPIYYYRKEIFDSKETIKSFASIEPKELLKEKDSIKRIWCIVPFEYYFYVPHFNTEAIDAYLTLLENNFKLKSCWRGEKINVYLYSAQ